MWTPLLFHRMNPIWESATKVVLKSHFSICHSPEYILPYSWGISNKWYDITENFHDMKNLPIWAVARFAARLTNLNGQTKLHSVVPYRMEHRKWTGTGAWNPLCPTAWKKTWEGCFHHKIPCKLLGIVDIWALKSPRYLWIRDARPHLKQETSTSVNEQCIHGLCMHHWGSDWGDDTKQWLPEGNTCKLPATWRKN